MGGPEKGWWPLRMDSFMGGKIFCGIFYSGARVHPSSLRFAAALRGGDSNGGERPLTDEGNPAECLGGCSQVGKQSCSSNVLTESCMLHDVCTVVQNSLSDTACGSVARDNFDKCIPVRPSSS